MATLVVQITTYSAVVANFFYDIVERHARILPARKVCGLPSQPLHGHIIGTHLDDLMNLC